MFFIFYIMSFFFLMLGSIFFFISLFLSSIKISFLLNWGFMYNSFFLSFPFYFDFISCLFISIVFFISGSIIFYSEYYMKTEIYKSRFFYLMFLFVLSMIFLILSPNLFCMLLGWDGLGLISYCLVIYYQNFKSNNSGMITALTNRVGDVFILASICMFFFFGSFNYQNFFDIIDLKYLIFFFFVASLTKSAQVPFSAWLPAAMAAPTPVSSLVHSSTLVTAGVYILIRFNYYLSENFKVLLIFISLMTMIMSGFSGVLEFDLKKIIALSTLSQLGFMMSTIGLGFPKLAFFHLITHAGFKALLFMCAGLFIHSFFDVQDIRLYGLLTKNFSFILCFFNIANLSLSGFPFLSGFFSKDLILELMLMQSLNFFFLFLFLLGTFLTVFYSFRLFIFLTFNNCFFFPVEFNKNSLGVKKSMIILYFFTIMLGYFCSNLFFFPFNFIVMPMSLKGFISVICLVSFFFSLLFSSVWKIYKNLFIMFLSQMWFLGFLKTDFLKVFFLKFCYFSSKSLVGNIEDIIGLKYLKKIWLFSYFLNFLLVNNFFLFFCFMFFFFMFFLVLLI